MELTDVRRLTGASLVLDRPGAAAETVLNDDQKDEIISAWTSHMRKILDAVDWPQEEIITRSYDGGATLLITAPIDALYAATDLIEAAWEMTEHEIQDERSEDFNAKIAELNEAIAEERNPNLLELASAAEENQVTLLSDDEIVSLGLGINCQKWDAEKTPSPAQVDWQAVSDIPVALVTGTNGKSTTVRLSAAICAAAGKTVGMSSSDWVRAGKDIIANGDYSGPEGARLALRDPRVDMAIIETARGGLLRRGLPIAKTAACLITNIASDHLGDYGIKDVPALADVKFTVAKAVATQGTLILNADDPLLVEKSKTFPGKISWYGFSINKDNFLDWHDGINPTVFVEDDQMMLAENGSITPLLRVKDFAPALGGVARYNVSNALGAIALTRVLGIDHLSITQGLKDFDSTPEDNPGRGNFMTVAGVNVLVDFAHNPHGISALADAVNNFPANRRLFLLGQAGDRSDEDIRAMAKAVRDANPDMIIIKEMETHLRGRELGEIPEMIRHELDRLDFPESKISHANSELEAVKRALDWAVPDDLLVLLIYDQRQETLDLLRERQSELG
jgi:UDP-N-acetylmuramyl tripeptide synthase